MGKGTQQCFWVQQSSFYIILIDVLQPWSWIAGHFDPFLYQPLAIYLSQVLSFSGFNMRVCRFLLGTQLLSVVQLFLDAFLGSTACSTWHKRFHPPFFHSSNGCNCSLRDIFHCTWQFTGVKSCMALLAQAQLMSLCMALFPV